MNSAIFRQYDIRGVADRDLTPDVISALSRALAYCLLREGVTAVAVGRDCRLSSPRIAGRLMRELARRGLEVIDLGLVPTPVVYFSQHYLQVEAGLVVTGSHNPAADNGLKCVVQGESWYGDRIQLIRRVCQERPALPEKKPGRVRTVEILADYEDAVLQRTARPQRPIRVVVDCGNGATGGLAARIYQRMGCRVSELFGEPDGRFPNHHPDPAVESHLTALKRSVREQEADLGIAFDGDGDRIAAVDSEGEPVWGDYLTLLFAQDVLDGNPGAMVIGEVKCTAHLFREVERLGGKSLMLPSGHSLIKQEMRRTGALLAGEMSGHIFFADRYFGFDDAIYAGARLLELISRKETSLAGLLGRLPASVCSPEIKIAVADEEKFQLVERAREWFSDRYETILVDGVRIEFDDGWGLIRASNTGPCLTLRFEADTEERLAEIRNLIASPLSAIIEGRGERSSEVGSKSP